MSGNRRRQKATAVLLATVVVGMVGLSFAAVPLYRVFCQVTGFGGTTQRAEAAPEQVSNRIITVRFDSEVNPELPWRFEPAQASLKVKVGETATAFYRATNRSDVATVGQATFNVTPLKAGLYFDKIQCFCFSEQRLAPGESADMPVTFFVSPDILKDRNLDDVDTITLSYTFFRNKELERQSNAASASGDNNQIAGAAAPRVLNGGAEYAAQD